MAFSFLRGDRVENTAQKPITIGMAVISRKKIVVFQPPPIFHERYAGTPPMREKRRRLEKLSPPGPSAGNGAFLIAGYCKQTVRKSATDERLRIA